MGSRQLHPAQALWRFWPEYLKNSTNGWICAIPAGMSIGGGFNRILHNRINGYERSIMLIDPCEGNYVAGNDFARETTRFCGEGTPARLRCDLTERMKHIVQSKAPVG